MITSVMIGSYFMFSFLVGLVAGHHREPWVFPAAMAATTLGSVVIAVVVHWAGIDGWLYFLAAVSFLLAALSVLVSWRHISGRGLMFIALGLLLWVLTFILTS